MAITDGAGEGPQTIVHPDINYLISIKGFLHKPLFLSFLEERNDLESRSLVIEDFRVCLEILSGREGKRKGALPRLSQTKGAKRRLSCSAKRGTVVLHLSIIQKVGGDVSGL
jgi:hypothetical protein